MSGRRPSTCGSAQRSKIARAAVLRTHPAGESTAADVAAHEGLQLYHRIHLPMKTAKRIKSAMRMAGSARSSKWLTPLLRQRSMPRNETSGGCHLSRIFYGHTAPGTGPTPNLDWAVC